MAANIVDKSIPSFKIFIDGQEMRTDMEVGSINVENSLDAPDQASFIVINSVEIPEQDIKWFGEQLTLGQEIEIKLGYADKLDTVFIGIATSVKINLLNDGTNKLEVIASDFSYAMTKNITSFTWNEKKDSDIASSMASTYQLKPNIEDTEMVHRSIEQDEADFDFLKMRAAENAYEFYVFNRNLYFREPTYDEKPIATVTLGDNLISFTAEMDIADQDEKVADKIASSTKTNWSHCLTKATGDCPGSPKILPGNNLEIKGVGKALSKDHYYIEKTVHKMFTGNYLTTFYVRQLIKNA